MHSMDGGQQKNRSRPSSMVAEENLDEMLGRVRKLREERQQILKDMAMLKDAFKEPDSSQPDVDHESKNL